MCRTVLSPVGASSVPAAMETPSAPTRSQKREPPHSRQNPRRAAGEERYQARVAWLVRVTSAHLAFV
ncbi:hypothetical protein D3C83_303450 [compost metagenome]